MSQITKLVDKFINDPASVKYSELEKILIHFGFEKIKAKGSHVKFKHVTHRYDLIIPIHHNECKDFYKKEAKKKIDEIKSKSK